MSTHPLSIHKLSLALRWDAFTTGTSKWPNSLVMERFPLRYNKNPAPTSSTRTMKARSTTNQVCRTKGTKGPKVRGLWALGAVSKGTDAEKGPETIAHLLSTLYRQYTKQLYLLRLGKFEQTNLGIKLKLSNIEFWYLLQSIAFNNEWKLIYQSGFFCWSSNFERLGSYHYK